MARHFPSIVALAVAALALGACEKRPDFSRGGTRLTFRVAAGSTPEQREQALRRVQQRLTQSRLLVVTARAGEDLTIDVPTDGDIDKVKNLATTRGQLIVRDEATTDGQIVIDRIAKAHVERDEKSRRGTLIIQLRPEDAAKVGALSQKIVGKKMVVSLDGSVLSRPVVQTAIPGDRLQIGLPAIHDPKTADAEAAALIALVDGGALPVTVNVALEENITPQKR